MKYILFALIVSLTIIQITAICDNWVDNGGQRLCKRALFTHIIELCGDYEAIYNSEHPVENLSTCCCKFGCSDEFLLKNLCPSSLTPGEAILLSNE